MAISELRGQSRQLTLLPSCQLGTRWALSERPQSPSLPFRRGLPCLEVPLESESMALSGREGSSSASLPGAGRGGDWELACQATPQAQAGTSSPVPLPAQALPQV